MAGRNILIHLRQRNEAWQLLQMARFFCPCSFCHYSGIRQQRLTEKKGTEKIAQAFEGSVQSPVREALAGSFLAVMHPLVFAFG